MTAALLFSPQMLTLYGVIALGAIHAIQAIRAAAPSSSTPATPNVPAVHPATPNSPTPTGHPVLDAIKHMLGGATALRMWPAY
jgi:hypothetical protein